ncbi:MAG: ATP-binding protein [Propionibacteriales bacterium]|nr:ATP-binding protein [Propionibacteriales bacterium]
MARVLITGMSGAGKSTLVQALTERGFTTVDTDQAGWEISPARWDVPRMRALLDDQQTVAVCGTAENQGEFYDQFDHVAYLVAPLEVLLDRVRRRTTSPYGKTPQQQADITRYVAEVEPLIRRSATIELDARRPVEDLTDQAATLMNTPQVISPRPVLS